MRIKLVGSTGGSNGRKHGWRFTSQMPGSSVRRHLDLAGAREFIRQPLLYGIDTQCRKSMAIDIDAAGKHRSAFNAPYRSGAMRMHADTSKQPLHA
jgi:hypothetical protein